MFVLHGSMGQNRQTDPKRGSMRDQEIRVSSVSVRGDFWGCGRGRAVFCVATFARPWACVRAAHVLANVATSAQTDKSPIRSAPPPRR